MTDDTLPDPARDAFLAECNRMALICAQELFQDPDRAMHFLGHVCCALIPAYQKFTLEGDHATATALILTHAAMDQTIGSFIAGRNRATLEMHAVQASEFDRFLSTGLGPIEPEERR